MDKNQQLLVKLLSAAIHNEDPSQIKSEGVDWNTIFNEAMAHDIHGLLYPAMMKLQTDELPNSELISKWKKSTLLSGIRQVRHIQEVSNVLKEFRRMNIPVIALKGLVLRELYPEPELRSMSDADILVHNKDMASAKDLLLRLGYYEDSDNGKHIHFSHKTELPIELHRSLIEHTHFKNISSFENSIWKNSIPVNIGDAHALALSLDDQVLHLCLHMAVHITSSGFGLRQLCDLALLIESKYSVIDWDSFYKKAKLCGIERFVQAIFMVCNQLLGMEIPNFHHYKIAENDPCMDLIVKDIFSGGIFGKSSMERVVANTLLHFSNHKASYLSSSKLIQLLTFLFPSAQTFGERYFYAKRNPMLTPIAWIHRFIYCLIRKDLTSSQKKAFLFSASSEPILNERFKLLKLLDLI